MPPGNRKTTRFVHFFIFADEAAHTLHGESAAVKRFESVYSPELVGEAVIFTDYNMIASNSEWPVQGET
jgi:hypothetical protein